MGGGALHVILLANKILPVFWAEAMNNANWLRRRSPAARIEERIHILELDPSTTIALIHIHAFGQPVYAFLHR